ncbi:MAG: response regulator [Deltaproteobacteria bacterium]|nr:response regulator [Deltaproteobacteria bacterium]
MDQSFSAQKVLVVDDVPLNLRIIADTLKDQCTIVAALDGEKALSLAGTDPMPDLILLDVMMPGMDGYEVCQRLQQSEKTRGIPVIFLTARTNPDDIVKGFEVGAVDYVTKPFNASELRARVLTHLKLKMTIARLEESLSEIKRLSGLLPICGHCKKIRSDDGYWQQVEAYISEHSEVKFSHGICPECVEKYYPEIAKKWRVSEVNSE